MSKAGCSSFTLFASRDGSFRLKARGEQHGILCVRAVIPPCRVFDRGDEVGARHHLRQCRHACRQTTALRSRPRRRGLLEPVERRWRAARRFDLLDGIRARRLAGRIPVYLLAPVATNSGPSRRDRATSDGQTRQNDGATANAVDARGSRRSAAGTGFAGTARRRRVAMGALRALVPSVSVRVLGSKRSRRAAGAITNGLLDTSGRCNTVLAGAVASVNTRMARLGLAS